MERKKLCKISTADDNNKYYLLTTIRDEGKKGISLVLSDGLVAWSGEIDSADLVHTSEKLKMKTDEYFDQTCKALTGEHSGSLTFQYQVKRNGGFAGLSWKKTVSGIKFQLGSVTLTSEKNPSSVIQAMFDYCIESSATQSQEIRTLSANKERLSSERLNAIKRLEKCTAVKESLETDLYSKFQVIINSKKSKLRDLRDEVEEVRSGAATQTASRGNATSKRQMSSSPEPDAGKGSDEDKSDNYNTDDDEPSAKKRRNAVVVPPDADSLIFLDDEEDKKEKTAPLARRQRRQQGSQKKQTPSKPVIPKVSSSKKPSLTRGGSGSSSGSSGARSGRRSATQANADDLMDMM